MDIDKGLFKSKYIHNMSVTTALVYFTLLQSSDKYNGRLCCKERSILWLEQITRKKNSQVCDALNKLQELGLITIVHTYKPLSESKVAIKRRAKKGSDAPAYDTNTYYINSIR
jgi:hypothetical protein